MREFEFYKPIVIARDGTILAGHGIAEAARPLGIETVPVTRLDLDPDDPKALKILVDDNKVSGLAEQDDRALSEMLRGVPRTPRVVSSASATTRSSLLPS